MIAAISTGTRRIEPRHRLDSMAGLAFDEAMALLTRNEPKGPDALYTPCDMMAHFDSGTALAEALAAFISSDSF